MNNRSKSFWIMITPAFVGLILVLFIPLLIGGFYSLTNWNGNVVGDFVGFENFMKLFHDNGFKDSLWFTTKFSIVSIILINIIALSLALIVTQKLGKWNTFLELFILCRMLLVELS